MVGQADPEPQASEDDFSEPLADFDILYPTAEPVRDCLCTHLCDVS